MGTNALAFGGAVRRTKRLPRPFAALSGPGEVVRQFTPNWFAATMGTGIVALALAQFPLAVPGLHRVAVGLWLANIGLFGVCTVLYAARWILHFEGAKRILGHSIVSMFLGAIPMGLATIVNGFLAFGPALIGPGVAVAIAHALWRVDVLLAIGTGLFVPYWMFTRQSHAMESMTAVWLLPVVAAEVAAVSAGLLAAHVGDPRAAFRIVLIGYGLWAFSVPLAFGMLAILFQRLALHRLPPRDLAATGWLALGPIGTGALGLMVLGGAARDCFAANGLGTTGETAFGLGVLGGTVLLGFGLWWLLLAVLTTLRYLREGLPFNLGWWGFVFPLAVYAIAMLTLGRLTGIGAPGGIGVVLVAVVTAVWVAVSWRTARGAWRGDLFVAPCLKETAVLAID